MYIWLVGLRLWLQLRHCFPLNYSSSGVATRTKSFKISKLVQGGNFSRFLDGLMWRASRIAVASSPRRCIQVNKSFALSNVTKSFRVSGLELFSESLVITCQDAEISKSLTHYYEGSSSPMKNLYLAFEPAILIVRVRIIFFHYRLTKPR